MIPSSIILGLSMPKTWHDGTSKGVLESRWYPPWRKSVLDLACGERNKVSNSFLPFSDSLMKAGEVAGSPSQTFKNSQRSALDQFIQYTADEQLGCDFFGAVGCENATTLEVDLIKTADFLLDQKIVPNLGVLNISKVNNAVTSCTGGELCFQQVFEPNWLNEVQTLGDVLSVLEQIELSPFPENEIGRGTQGQIATGDSTCSGHRLVELTAAQVTIGDGANGITGLSYTGTSLSSRSYSEA